MLSGPSRQTGKQVRGARLRFQSSNVNQTPDIGVCPRSRRRREHAQVARFREVYDPALGNPQGPNRAGNFGRGNNDDISHGKHNSMDHANLWG
jgi:hypothetical protein